MSNKVIDPITLEVIWNRFLSVANEQQDALIRTAFFMKRTDPIAKLPGTWRELVFPPVYPTRGS